MEQLTTIQLEKRQNSFKIIIPEEVESKIRHTCAKIPTVEWSGALFYTYEGSFQDNNLIIKCVDFFVMDIGTSGYTEFDMNPDVIAYMTENNELLDCQMGLIHSHNTFATFFSGTDTNTLLEEGKDRNNFVSLIVNNAGDYTAAITRRVKTISSIEESNEYEFFAEGSQTSCDKYSETTEKIEYFMLTIVKEANNTFQDLDKRLDEIKEKKAKSSCPKVNTYKEYAPYYPNSQGTLFNNHTNWNDDFHWDKPYEVIKKPDKPTVNDYPYTKPIMAKDNEKNIKNVSSFIDNFFFDEDKIHKALLQLVTGCVNITDSKKIDPYKFSYSMVQLYDNTFGKDGYGFVKFKTWAEGFIDFLCIAAEDNKLSQCNLDDDMITTIFAVDLSTALKKVGNNKYIECFIDILNSYIL